MSSPESSKIATLRNLDWPWPDDPKIPKYSPGGGDFDPFNDFGPPSRKEIRDENILMLRGQRLFRWAAQTIAISISQLPEIERVAAFGAVAQPLLEEVPRFKQFRRYGIEILHECADLDLAVWMTTCENLMQMKKARGRGLAPVQTTAYGGVAQHQVDFHLFDFPSGAYRGRLCNFGECPKPRKLECLAPRCGEKPFLQQFPNYRFNRLRFEGEPKVLLFDRNENYLVHIPQIDLWSR